MQTHEEVKKVKKARIEEKLLGVTSQEGEELVWYVKTMGIPRWAKTFVFAEE